MAQLRRRQNATAGRAQRRAKKARAEQSGLPGKAAEVIGKALDDAAGHMKKAGGAMGKRDASSAKQQARAAAQKLGEAQQAGQKAARMAQRQGRSGLRDEPIRIPGADEYRAPQEFREDILDAMKKQAPNGFQDMVKRYYEDLIR